MGWCCGENLDVSNPEIVLADVEAEEENKELNTHLIPPGRIYMATED